MSCDLRELLADTAPGPTRDVDLDALAAAARRRRRVRRAGAVGGIAAVLVAAVVVPTAVDRDAGPFPPIGDTPDDEETPVDVPDGWVTLTAGDLAISVPPDWDVDVRDLPDGAPPETGEGGPCSYDLVPGVLDDDPGTSRAVVYDGPSQAVCNLIGHGPPDRPGLVLYTTIRGEVDGIADQLGAERNHLAETAVRDRVGAVEVWRSIPHDSAAGEVDTEGGDDRFAERVETYVAADLTGGLWVAMPDDPITQQVLSTLRPAPGAVPRDLPVTTSYRDLAPEEWHHLAARPSAEYLGGGRILEDQAALDDLWPRLHFDDDPPTLPAGTAAIAGATYAGGLPGGCHQRREVIGVRVSGVMGLILLGDLAPGWREDTCSDEAFVHLVTVPQEVAERFTVVSTVVADEWEFPASIAPDAAAAARLSAEDVRVLAAVSTDDPSLTGVVVPRDDRGFASVWGMGGAAGEPPELPEGTVGLFVIARETPGTCRSPDDVVGVEVRGYLAVVLLDPYGEVTRPCPGPEGAAAFTAFAVAIPEGYGHRLGGAAVAFLGEEPPDVD